MVWNINFIFPEILGISSSQLTNIFQRGSNHQPDNIYIYILYIHNIIYPLYPIEVPGKMWQYKPIISHYDLGLYGTVAIFGQLWPVFGMSRFVQSGRGARFHSRPPGAWAGEERFLGPIFGSGQQFGRLPPKKNAISPGSLGVMRMMNSGLWGILFLDTPVYSLNIIRLGSFWDIVLRFLVAALHSDIFQLPDRLGECRVGKCCLLVAQFFLNQGPAATWLPSDMEPISWRISAWALQNDAGESAWGMIEWWSYVFFFFFTRLCP